GRDVQLVPLLLVEREIFEGSVSGIANGASEHLSQDRDSLAMRARVGTFCVDRRSNQLDEALQELLLVVQEQLIVKGNGGLRAERFHHALVLPGECLYVASRIPRVDQLYDTDHDPFVGGERYG